PMLAPRVPAPTSVGAPIRETLFMVAFSLRRRGETFVETSPIPMKARRFGSDLGPDAGITTLCRAPQTLGAFQVLPAFFGRLDDIEQLQVGRADHAGVDEEVEVDQARPEVLVEQEDGPRARLARLDQRQHLEELVERPEAAREARQRDRAHEEVHLAQGE